MRRLLRVATVLAVLLLLTTAGCYTVLKHPTGGSIVQEGSYYRSCADCHADAAYYHPYSHSNYRYGRSHYGWSDYYGYPWWYNDYWWWDSHDGDDYDGPEVEKGARHLWSSDGWASGGWGFRTPTSSGSTAPVRAPDSSNNEQDDDKDKDKKKEEDKPHVWKPRKKGF